ncbi:hypothetical protein PQX77_000088 [Marasmius sp. AFHP31]|nr:hypothetical protein PQX77_000088 [Marasmius sp. AFHP31]
MPECRPRQTRASRARQAFLSSTKTARLFPQAPSSSTSYFAFNMYFRNPVLCALPALITLLADCPAISASTLPSTSQVRSLYARAHSLGNSYIFQSRDGWISVNATDLPYKYRHDHQVVEARSREHEDKKVKTSVKVAQDAQNARKGRKKENSKEGANTPSQKSPKPKTIPKLKAESILDPVAGSSGEKFRTSGEAEPVTITWYVL